MFFIYFKSNEICMKNLVVLWLPKGQRKARNKNEIGIKENVLLWLGKGMDCQEQLTLWTFEAIKVWPSLSFFIRYAWELI